MQVRNDIPEHRLIIGVIRDSQIHVEQSAFQLFASGLFDKCVTISEAKFMVACDGGENWNRLLERKVLFGIDETGTPCFVEGGLAVPKMIAPTVPIEGELITPTVN